MAQCEKAAETKKGGTIAPAGCLQSVVCRLKRQGMLTLCMTRESTLDDNQRERKGNDKPDKKRAEECVMVVPNTRYSPNQQIDFLVVAGFESIVSAVGWSTLHIEPFMRDTVRCTNQYSSVVAL